jgi:two-component system OmpR family response regulator
VFARVLKNAECDGGYGVAMINNGAVAMPAARVLLVEDDAALREGLAAALGAEGYDVCGLYDGRDLDRLATSYRPDVGIFDVRLGEGPNGFELATRLRALSGVPVLFLTAADALEDRLRGFQIGADDYLVKPFALAELLARVRVVLRRSGRLSSATWQLRDLVVDEAARVVNRGDIVIDLTDTEFEILCALGRRPGEAVSKLQLLTLVWGFDQYDPNLVEVHVSALRRKLEAAGPRLIHTVRGAGYAMRP